MNPNFIIPNPNSGTRVVFMGTPDFAVASLDALIKAGFTIVGVITAPDKPAGRGMRINESAVKKYAVKHGVIIIFTNKNYRQFPKHAHCIGSSCWNQIDGKRSS